VDEDGGGVSILVVCTANQCRSPLAEAALRRWLEAAGAPVTVASAGVAAMPGIGATPPTVDAARRIGLDISDHAATALDADAVRAADLVLGLERRHVQEIVLHDPTSFPRTFTLRELVRRGADVGPRADDQSIGEWLAEVGAQRRPTDVLGASTVDDIADPTGSQAVDHHSMADEVDGLARELVALLYPDRAPGGR
jgi:protein-tyrosine phosphatase